MAAVVERGTSLPAVVVEEMFNLVKGKSSLAKLSPERPYAFNGNEFFTFSLDKEVDIVGESKPKSNGGGEVKSVVQRPVKFEYGMRVSDEFLYGTEEYRLDILRNFAEGAARKGARGLDIAAMHGVNPRTGEPSDLIGKNCLDKMAGTTIKYDAEAPDTNLDDAVAAVQAFDGDITGIAMAPWNPVFRLKLRKDRIRWMQLPAIICLPATARVLCRRMRCVAAKNGLLSFAKSTTLTGLLLRLINSANTGVMSA